MNENDLRNTLGRVAERARPEPAAFDRLVRGHRRRQVRRKAASGLGVTAAIAAIAMVAVTVAGNDPGGPPPPFGSDGPDPVAARDLVYAHRGEIYVARDGGEPERITRDDRWDSRPVWHRGEVHWASAGDDGTVTIRRATGGGIEDVATFEGAIHAFALRGDRIAVLFAPPAGGQRVLVLEPGGTRETIWTFPVYDGRGTNTEDEVSLAWSPDGTGLLVVNTYVDTASERRDETLLLLDDTGRAILPARNGTHGRWSPDGTAIYYERYGDGSGWVRLDTATGVEEDLPGMPVNVAYPSVSPDGTLLAFTDPAARATVRVYDLGARALTAFETAGAAPRWLGETSVVVTAAEPCPPAECAGDLWVFTGRTIEVSYPDGERGEAAAASTVDASVGRAA